MPKAPRCGKDVLKTVVHVVPNSARALPLHLLRRQPGLPLKHPEPLRAPRVSTVEFSGQNGKVLIQQLKTKTACA